MPKRPLIVIKGAGDLASGVAHRLYRAGYRLLMTELARPTTIRRTVAFSQAVYDRRIEIEGVVGQRADQTDWLKIENQGLIPVLPDADQPWLDSLTPAALIEATLSKKNTGLSRQPGRLTLALGPGYQAGADVEAVVETARGHFMGQLIVSGSALPDTGQPGQIGGHDLKRLIRAPAAGTVRFTTAIGDAVRAGDILGRVDDRPITAAINGVLRGALMSGLVVPENFKIGDIDPRPEAAAFIHTPSDKARAVAGGILEGLLYFKLGPYGPLGER